MTKKPKRRTKSNKTIKEEKLEKKLTMKKFDTMVRTHSKWTKKLKNKILGICTETKKPVF